MKSKGRYRSWREGATRRRKGESEWTRGDPKTKLHPSRRTFIAFSRRFRKMRQDMLWTSRFHPGSRRWSNLSDFSEFFLQCLDCFLITSEKVGFRLLKRGLFASETWQNLVLSSVRAFPVCRESAYESPAARHVILLPILATTFKGKDSIFLMWEPITGGKRAYSCSPPKLPRQPDSTPPLLACRFRSATSPPARKRNGREA